MFYFYLVLLRLVNLSLPLYLSHSHSMPSLVPPCRLVLSDHAAVLRICC